MKKTVSFLAVLLAAAALNSQGAGSTLYVAAKTVELKASPRFFAQATGTLAQGDAVQVTGTDGRWVNVQSAPGLRGFAPADAFSSRRILSTGASVSGTEFAMAGKGFNSNLEQSLSSAGGFDYTAVDTMEKYTVSPDALRAFLEEGRLALGK